MELLPILALANGVIVWLLLAALLPPAALVGVGLSMWCLNLSWLVPATTGRLAGLLGAATIAVAILRARSMPAPPRVVPKLLQLPFAVGLAGLFLSPAALNPLDAALVSLGVALMGGLLLASVRYMDGLLVSRAAFWAVSFAMVSSLFVIAVSIGQTNYNGRALGIFSNPNTLGMAGGLWLALSLSRRRAWIPVLPMSLFAIFESGSRGALLASVGALLAWLWLGGLRRGRLNGASLRALRIALLVLTLAFVRAAADYYASGRASAPDEGVIRTGESGRLALLEFAWQRFLERPLTGWGLGTEHVNGVSHPHVLPMTLGFQMGVLGFALAAAAVLILASTFFKGSPGLAALGAFGLLAMPAESWLFGAGSFLAWAFWFGFGGQFAASSHGTRAVGAAVPRGTSAAGSRDSEMIMPGLRPSGRASGDVKSTERGVWSVAPDY